jgi:SOS response regulatory protein OraA/RecX
MIVKTGLVVPGNRDESSDRWKFDQSGTQILLYRGFTQIELMRIFFVFT